jgi:hypothetical protein
MLLMTKNRGSSCKEAENPMAFQVHKYSKRALCIINCVTMNIELYVIFASPGQSVKIRVHSYPTDHQARTQELWVVRNCHIVKLRRLREQCIVTCYLRSQPIPRHVAR